MKKVHKDVPRKTESEADVPDIWTGRRQHISDKGGKVQNRNRNSDVAPSLAGFGGVPSAG